MSDQLQGVIAAAQCLPEPERWQLIGELLDSLSEEPEQEEAELLSTLEARAAEGLTNGIRWEDLRRAE